MTQRRMTDKDGKTVELVKRKIISLAHIDPKSGKTWQELAQVFVQMRINAALAGYGAAAKRVQAEAKTIPINRKPTKN